MHQNLPGGAGRLAETAFGKHQQRCSAAVVAAWPKETKKKKYSNETAYQDAAAAAARASKLAVAAADETETASFLPAHHTYLMEIAARSIGWSGVVIAKLKLGKVARYVPGDFGGAGVELVVVAAAD